MSTKIARNAWMFPHLGDILHAAPLMQVYRCSCSGKIALQRERDLVTGGTRFILHHFDMQTSIMPYRQALITSSDLNLACAPLGSNEDGLPTMTNLGASYLRSWAEQVHTGIERDKLLTASRFTTSCACGGVLGYRYDQQQRTYHLWHEHPRAPNQTAVALPLGELTRETFAGPLPFIPVLDLLACEDHILYGGGLVKDGYTEPPAFTLPPDAASRTLVADRPQPNLDPEQARANLWDMFESTMRGTTLRSGKTVYEEFADLYDEEVDRQQLADRLAGLLRDRVESPAGARAVVSALTNVLRQRILLLVERGEGGMPDAVGNPFAGLSVCVTGVIPGMDRDQARDALARLGARSQSAVDSRTNYLIVGDRPGRVKVTAAKALGVPTYTAQEFLRIILNTEQEYQASIDRVRATGSPEQERKPLLVIKPIPQSQTSGKVTASGPWVDPLAFIGAIKEAEQQITKQVPVKANVVSGIDMYGVDTALPDQQVAPAIGPRASVSKSSYADYQDAIKQFDKDEAYRRQRLAAVPKAFDLGREVASTCKQRLIVDQPIPNLLQGGMPDNANILLIGDCDEDESFSITKGPWSWTRDTALLNELTCPITHVVMGLARRADTQKTEAAYQNAARALLYAANMGIPLVAAVRYNGKTRWVNVWETPAKDAEPTSGLVTPKLTVNPKLLAFKTITIEQMGTTATWMIDALWTGSTRVEMNAELQRLGVTVAGSWSEAVRFFLTPDLMALPNVTIANINKYGTTVVADDTLRALFPTCWMKGKEREQFKIVRARKEEEARLTTIIIHERRPRSL